MSITQPVKARSRRRVAPRRVLFTLTPVLLLLVGGSTLGFLARVPDGQIAPGVRVGSLALGGMTQDAARLALVQWAQQKQNVILNLHFPAATGIKRTWKPNAEKLGLSMDTKATLGAAASSGRSGIVGQATRLITGGQPAPVAPRLLVDAKKLRTYLKQQVARDANRAAKNAKIVLNSKGGYKVLSDRTGIHVDIEASAAVITQAWMTLNAAETARPEQQPTTPASPDTTAPDKSPTDNNGDKSTGQNTPATKKPTDTPLEIELAAKVTKPAITAVALKHLGELGSFSTRFGGTGASRGSNIALAASHINGTLLAPGEIFSYNKVVGPRIESAGFQDAPVIVRGELVPGIGGGICQVSSTLYNAVLLSDLKIVTRSHHAFPVHYLPAGRDATVVDGAIDFKFQNNTPAPIYIVASSGKGHLAFRLLGKRKPGRSVSIELANHTTEGTPPAKTIKDPMLPAGRHKFKDKGHIGHHVTVYRVVRENGKVVKKELVSRDHYRPFAPTVIVGTRAVKPKAVKTKTLPVTPAPPPAPPAATP